ncbi:MAG TPA: exonuclease SbcC, partial [Nitrosopumilaceae archaeon]|nr:exonuclease SbcC [Nitrosopumilaceae archaeon]
MIQSIEIGIQNSKSKSEYQEFLKIRKEMDALALEEDKIKHEIDLQFSKISRPLGKYSYISSLEKPLKRIMEELIANPSKVLIEGNKDSIVEVLHAVIKAVVAGNVSVKDTTKAVQQIEETINRLDEFLKMKSDLSQKRDSFENRLGIFNISELEEKEGELIKTRDKKRHAESVAKNLENAVNDVIMHIPQLGRDIEIKLKEISGTRITLKI